MVHQLMLFGALLFVSLTVASDYPITCQPLRMGEDCVPRGEAEFHHYTANRVHEIQREVVKTEGLPFKRGFHSKSHGCYLAEFSVMNAIPTDYKVGPLFGNPGKEYKAIVRFSNGHPQTRSDVMPDFRGLAIKVLGVGGRKIRQANASTIDFLMMNAPLAPAKDAPGFVDFVNHTMPPAGTLDMAGYLIKRAPPETRSFIFRHLLNRVVNSVRTEQYWSVVAYKWGPTRAMKFTVKPCPHPPKPRLRDFFKGNKLREDVENIVKDRNICYDFFVQLQVDLWRTPVENVAVQWPEDIAKTVRVARLVIPQIDPESIRAQKVAAKCEKLRFTPFNTVEDYRPIGSGSRVREEVYTRSANVRRARQVEPDEHECFHC